MAEKQVRAFFGGVAKEIGDRQIRVIVSTGSVDRHGDIVEVEGIDLGPYRTNPVVLYMHDHRQPIARCSDMAVNGGRLEATVQFPEPGVSAKSDEIYGLIKAGILSAASIGFLPKEWSYMDDKNPWHGRKFTKSEMIEFSFVSVPANAEALVTERSLEDEIAKLVSEALAKHQNSGSDQGEATPEPAEIEDEEGENEPESTVDCALIGREAEIRTLEISSLVA